MQQVSLSDTLLFEPFPGGGWRFCCTDRSLTGPDNLVSRAVALLENQAGKAPVGVKITLFKNIPVEAGLAGGSSDAAAALKGLNYYWQLGLSDEKLLRLGLLLGSDVPFCLHGGTALVRGRGEQLEELPPLPFFWIILVLPQGAKVSTSSAYSSLDPGRMGKPSLNPLVEAIKKREKQEIESWVTGSVTNTFETVGLPEAASSLNMKKKLKRRGFYPALSGSGPALFMLITDYSLARSAVLAAEEEGCRAFLCWTINTSEVRRYV